MAKKVIVVGGGIIGASAAFHLARDGAEVTLLESAPKVGGVATAHSWAWLNASWGNPPEYVDLRMASLAQWRALAGVHPKLSARWCGGLLWDCPRDDMRAYVAARNALGYQADIISGVDAASREPMLAQLPREAVFVAGEGDIDPVAAAVGFAEAAVERSATVKTGIDVKRLVEKSGLISLELGDGTMLTADEIVLAVGTATPNLLSGIGITLAMERPPGLLITARARPGSLRGLVMAPGVHARQQADGLIIAGSEFTGANPGVDPQDTGQEIFAHLRTLLKPEADLKFEGFGIGERPTPADGFPAIGRPKGTKNLYVMVMHSGITLAPAAGSFAAREILEGARDPLLTLYHPDRLA
ncbi:MAG: FAD-binding oxidoreductase [Aestuariivirga sp.]